MTRNELYNKITPCGVLSYWDMVYLLESLDFPPQNEQIRLALINRISQNGTLSQQDWLLLARSINFIPGSPINAATVEGWLLGKCALTAEELKLFLDYAAFIDGSSPTFILTETGDFIVTETSNI